MSKNKYRTALQELLEMLPGCQAHEMNVPELEIPLGKVCENHATYDTGYRLPICDEHVAKLPGRMQKRTKKREYCYSAALRQAVAVLKNKAEEMNG